jgi:hypothetical protein
VRPSFKLTVKSGQRANDPQHSCTRVWNGTRPGSATEAAHRDQMMRTTQPPVVDGLSLAPKAVSSDTSTSTTATIQPSYAIVPDFFNGLLVGAASGALFVCGADRRLHFILGSERMI